MDGSWLPERVPAIFYSLRKQHRWFALSANAGETIVNKNATTRIKFLLQSFLRRANIRNGRPTLIKGAKNRYVPVRLESRHLTDSRFCPSRMREDPAEIGSGQALRRRRTTNDFSCLLCPGIFTNEIQEKWKAREKQTLTLWPSLVFDIPGRSCAFFRFRPTRIRSHKELVRNYASPSRSTR